MVDLFFRLHLSGDKNERRSNSPLACSSGTPFNSEASSHVIREGKQFLIVSQLYVYGRIYDGRGAKREDSEGLYLPILFVVRIYYILYNCKLITSIHLLLANNSALISF